jgi:hypothetical protein
MEPRSTAVHRLSSPCLLAVALLSVGCTYYLGRGGDLYSEGRYIEAAHVLEMSEPRLETATVAEQAEYGLYRGAALWRLGDLDGARYWLDYCQKREATKPDTLSTRERKLLEETIVALRADLDRRAAASGL